MSSVIIIAEAGVNHNGSADLARQLIDAAAEAGADYVKFQTFITALNISENAQKADYQVQNTANKSETQFEMVQKLELSFDVFKELKNYCQSKNIGFLSTAFDIPSVDFLASIGVKVFKIPSGEITNLPLLKHIARTAESVILSTGTATLQEVKNALEIIYAAGLPKEAVTVLHCTTQYPAPMADVNLRAMHTMQTELGVKVGYSDHTLGIEIPVAAAALGAAVIEKHFTLNKNLPGPDHLASLEPAELKQMVQAIRNVELAIAGSGKKEPATSEIKNIEVVRKSLHFRHALPKGHVLRKDDFITLRPGTGISPMKIETVIGARLNADVQANEMVQLNHFA